MSISKTNITSQKKIDRLSLLEIFGINTPEYLVIPCKTNIEEAQKKVLEFTATFNKLSIRTQSNHHKDEFASPKFINIPKNKAEEIIPKLLNDYTILISEAYNSNDAIKVGTIAVLDDKYIIELSYSGNSVDIITHLGLVDKRIVVDKIKINTIDDEDVLSIIKNLRKLPFVNVIYEISWFPYPVGCFGSNYIIWDITRWS